MSYPEDPDPPVDPADQDDANLVRETFDIEVPEADAVEQSLEINTEDDYE